MRFLALPGALGLGRITNVSVTGAFMETDINLPLASVVHIESIGAAGNARRKRLAANVVRCTESGVGLEWCQCASNSTLFAQFGSAYRNGVEFSSAASKERSVKPNLYFYQFEFKD